MATTPGRRTPPKAGILTGPGEAGDHQAATETSSSLHLGDVYDATGFTCYIHNIVLFDIHLRVDLSNSA